MGVFAVVGVTDEVTVYLAAWQGESQQTRQRVASEASECVKPEGAGKAHSNLDCPSEGPLLSAGCPSSPPRVPHTLLVPTLAAHVAGVPSEQEREADVFTASAAGALRFLHSCRFGGCLAAEPSVLPGCAGAMQAPASTPAGERSHLSRKPLRGHAVTSPGPLGRPHLGHEGDRTGMWHLLPRVHPATGPQPSTF